VSEIVLLTGATGFVGRQVLKALGAEKKVVRVVSRKPIDPACAGGVTIERTILTNDLFAEDADWWAQNCAGVDTIIHAAWYAEPGKYLQSSTNIDCLAGTLRIAQAAVQAGVRRFIGVGTCFEYELIAEPLSIETPLRPITPYAGAKAAAFMALSQYLPPAGVAFAWCRLFYLYGEGEDPRRLVPHLRHKLSAGEPAELTSGNQVRDFLDVREAGQLIVKAALGADQGAINVCSGVPITVRQLAEQVADEYGRRDLLKFGARPDNLVDPPYVVGVKGQGAT